MDDFRPRVHTHFLRMLIINASSNLIRRETVADRGPKSQCFMLRWGDYTISWGIPAADRGAMNIGGIDPVYRIVEIVL